MPLSQVADNYKKEGCKTKEEFIDIWKHIHRRIGYTPERKFWVHKFEMI